MVYHVAGLWLGIRKQLAQHMGSVLCLLDLSVHRSYISSMGVPTVLPPTATGEESKENEENKESVRWHNKVHAKNNLYNFVLFPIVEFRWYPFISNISMDYMDETFISCTNLFCILMFGWIHMLWKYIHDEDWKRTHRLNACSFIIDNLSQYCIHCFSELIQP